MKAEKIRCCFCEEKCVVVITTEKVSGKTRHVTSQCLNSIEDELKQPKKFVRIHDNTLVNLDCADGYIKGRGGRVVMDDETEYEVSKRRKKEFLKRYKA